MTTSQDLFSSLIANWDSASYNQNVILFHDYETSPDAPWTQRAPKESVNRLVGHQFNARRYSEFLLSRGMSLKGITTLQRMRFRIDGVEVVGRDIIFKAGVNPLIVEQMAARVNVSVGHKKTIVTGEYGDIVFWESETGKRTYHGEDNGGRAVWKDFSRERKVYKRNRTVR